MKSKLFLSILLVITIIQCQPQTDLFFDTYENGIYSNEAIGFEFELDEEKWDLHHQYNIMPDDVEDIKRELRESGSELLFFGLSKNNLFGTRGIAERVDLSLDDYFNMVYEINKDEIEEEDALCDTIIVNEIKLIDWMYTTGTFTFQEYQFKKDDFNVRLSFWCYTRLFNKYQSKFYNIIKTLSIEQSDSKYSSGSNTLSFKEL